MNCVRPECHRIAFRIVGNVPLCFEDLWAVRAEIADPLPRQEPHALHKTLDSHDDYRGTSLVYYCHRAGQSFIKIGVSQNVDGRMRALSTMLRPVHLLAVEPGGYYREGKRHAQFAHLRDANEWFRDSPELRDHIADVIAVQGAPSCKCPGAPDRCQHSVQGNGNRMGTRLRSHR